MGAAILKEFVRRGGIKLSLHYFDIETLGFEPKTDELITIQTQEIYPNGEPKGELVIYKRWGDQAFTEKELIDKAFTLLMNKNNLWNIPVGYNLRFEIKFLGTKFEKQFPAIFNWGDLFYRPMLDLHPLGILSNKGEFKGSGLDKVSGKPHDGSIIPEWFKEKKFDKIDEYVAKEAAGFLEFYRKCFGLMAGLKGDKQ